MEHIEGFELPEGEREKLIIFLSFLKDEEIKNSLVSKVTKLGAKSDGIVDGKKKQILYLLGLANDIALGKKKIKTSKFSLRNPGDATSQFLEEHNLDVSKRISALERLSDNQLRDIFDHLNEKKKNSFSDDTMQDMIKDKIEDQSKITELKKKNDNNNLLLSILMHDLKSPFNTLLGFSGMLVKRIAEGNPKRITEIASLMNSTTNKTFNLLTDLLARVNTQKNEVTIHQDNISIKGATNEVIEQLSDIAKEKKIRIVAKDLHNEDAYIDKQAFKIIMRNLIDNARKFTNEGGTITIETKEKKGIIEVKITDTGVGIKKEKLHDIFAFKKGKSTTGTKNENGNGFGLHICEQLVIQNGGKIRVESEEGKGTTFGFTIPTYQTNQQ